MIQFNLLPDVKLEYIKARQTKRLVIMIAAIVAGVAIALVVILFLGVNVVQKNHLKNLASDIERDSKQLQEEKDLNKILTVQNQLHSLNDLHAQKPAVERMGTFLKQLTPKDVSVSTLDVDFTGYTMSFEGNAKSLGAVNQFIDTLKFTEYATNDTTDKAFSSVVLASFGRNDADTVTDGDARPATYKVTLIFNQIIFDNTQEIELLVPNTVTTRSATEKPDGIFQPQTGTEGEE